MLKNYVVDIGRPTFENRNFKKDVKENGHQTLKNLGIIFLVDAILSICKCSKFDVQSFEAKNWVFEFDYQLMNTFEFVQCLKK